MGVGRLVGAYMQEVFLAGESLYQFDRFLSTHLSFGSQGSSGDPASTREWWMPIS